MKKFIAVLLTVVLTAAVAIGGTLAYLTDRDSEANVFTVGDVNITLKEEFEQGSQLIPGKEIEKNVQIKNDGPNAAWVWYTYAIPQGLENGLNLTFDNASNWTNEATAIGTTTVDGVIYNVYACKYNTAVPAGETTEIGLTKVTMDPAVDITPDGDLYKVEAGVTEQLGWNINTTENPIIFINAYAIQAEGFADVNAAYNAFIGQWGNMVDAGTYANADTWDGTADTTWYDDTATEFTITTAEQMAGLADLVDEGKTFEGKTMKLGKDIDLYAVDANGERISFDPIGYGYNVVFKGTFDGQGHTIKNLYQNGWALGLDYSTEGGGLFASVVDATIKDLTIDSAEIVMECIDMGTLVGYSYGNCTYENITIKDSVIANYNRYTGGVIGEINGTQTFKNVDVIDTTVSALWGTYDASVGGIIGGKWGEAAITMEDCDVSAVLDVFNDACSNYQYYQYRHVGMLIGESEEVTAGTATASYLTCTNCTVTYGDWANYTYCEFEANGKGSYAGEGEWKCSRVQEGYATGGVDPNHTHDTDEMHEELYVVDQLFGGNMGVKGGKAHTGVTVIYNN